MDLKSYLAELSPGDRKKFAESCDSTWGHLRNISYGYRGCAEKLAIAIERESGGRVPCEELRSDVDWAYLRTRGTARSLAEKAI
jgi:DNA-binding transcriptional regulator YdaS (Cro superfamily)